MKNINITSNTILRFALLLVILLSGVAATHAATFTVNSTSDPGDGICDDFECTLREAMTASNANAGADIILLQVNGTINLTSALPDIADDLKIGGPGKDQLTVRRDTGGDYGIFRVIALGNVTISGLTISNAAAASGIDHFGFGTLTVDSVTISGNVDSGGILATADGIINITNSTIASNAGTGIHSLGATFSVTNSTIEGNGGGGIATSDQGFLTLTDSVVSGNLANFGAGISNFFGSTLIINRSTLRDNHAFNDFDASGRGGAIYNQGGNLEIRNSTISGNSAVQGGGIYLVQVQVFSNDVHITNTTISGNSALYGGGIFQDHGQADTVNVSLSTVTGNSATNGGGGIFITSTSAPITLKSTIVDLNTSGGDLNGTIHSDGYNVVGPLSVNADFLPTTGDQIGITSDQLKLGPLQDNGGPTMTHALLPGSVALDRGVNTDALPTDQRGFERTFDDLVIPNSPGGDGTDVGAFELKVPPFSDLLISLGADKTSVKQGDLLTYTITVQNFGHYAVNTIVNDVIASGATLYSVHANKGHFTAPPPGQTGTVTWYLDTLLDGDQQSAQLQVTVIIKGKTTITNSATVASDVPDPNMANNSASLTTSVTAGGGGSKK